MKNKYHVSIAFRWFDFWIGYFVDVAAESLYICLVPMLPIKIWITKHEVCPVCGALMQKFAYDIAPEGWDLQWNCENCEENGMESWIQIDWQMDFACTDYITTKDLKRFGYEIR